MDGEAPAEFARRYFEEQRARASGTRAERLAWRQADDSPSNLLMDWLGTDNLPERAWPLILSLIDAAPDEASLSGVAAGPLEDLIRGHGAAFADRIVEQARRDARFRSALRDVWGWESVPESLRRRVFELFGPPA